MNASKDLIMYGRTLSCPFINVAKRVLAKENVPFRELHIDMNDVWRDRVLAWTGFQSVPTMVVARVGEDLPFEEPAPLPAGESPRGINRGSIITEASEEELIAWLRQHEFIT
jgi:glutaredoxin